MPVSSPLPATNPEPGHGHLSITTVERETGIGKDTLRAWERRYGFPTPLRDARGERLYPSDQVARLRRVKRLLDLGWRPGKIFAANETQWDAWLAQHAPTQLPAHESSYLIQLVKMQRSEELRSRMQLHLLKEGLVSFVTDTLAPLNTAVGDAWLRGDIEVSEEHLYTEHVQNLLRHAISGRGETRHPPRILLTTLPNEWHSLGLLMVEALCVSEGARCVSLGTQTPLADIIAAMKSGDFDVLGLSFSAAFPQRLMAVGLETLARALPPRCEIWVGGRGAVHRLPSIPKVRRCNDVADVIDAIEQWRRKNNS